MANSLANRPQKFSVAIKSDMYKNLINDTLGDKKKAQKLIADVSSVVAINPELQDCEAGTILSGALVAASLDLSLSPQLGQCYLVPYNDNTRNRKVAQFQIGYKGYIQLAIRSGQYKKINVIAMKEGELNNFDPLNEVIDATLIEDEEARENATTTGYYAMFELINGFRKAMYWSKPKMESHAMKYSKGYAKKKGYTYWEKEFDEMAFKTMLRQLISKWGIMSIEMQDAYENDMAVVSDGHVEYVENDEPMAAIESPKEPKITQSEGDDPFSN